MVLRSRCMELMSCWVVVRISLGAFQRETLRLVMAVCTLARAGRKLVMAKLAGAGATAGAAACAAAGAGAGAAGGGAACARAAPEPPRNNRVRSVTLAESGG